MSVSMHYKKSLGSDLNFERVLAEVTYAVMQMETDAKEMNVELDWSSVMLRLGEDAYEEYGYLGTRRYPELAVTVIAERKQDA